MLLYALACCIASMPAFGLAVKCEPYAARCEFVVLLSCRVSRLLTGIEVSEKLLGLGISVFARVYMNIMRECLYDWL